MRTYIAASAGLWLAVHAATAGEYRTVTWFADHPAEMSGVLKLCRDNAGLAPRNPNCVNADEAQALVFQRELGWRNLPGEREHQLWVCDSLDKQHVTPAPMTAEMCRKARGQ